MEDETKCHHFGLYQKSAVCESGPVRDVGVVSLVQQEQILPETREQMG